MTNPVAHAESTAYAHGASGAPPRERITALDVVRGVAVAGILFANVLTFFGLFALSDERLAAFPTAAADRVAAFLEHTLVSGKFYSIFSLLFGIGFGVQLARGGDDALPRFRRRLKILLAIGAVHAVLVWAGDILMLYALLGFTLPWFARRTDRELLRWTVILLAIPTVLYVAGLAVRMALSGGVVAAATGDPGLPPIVRSIFEAVPRGGLRESFTANLVLLVGRWADLIVTVRFPKVLGMFVLGLLLVRRGVALAPAAHRALLTRWALLGWGIGLPANLLAAWAMDRWDYLPPSPGGLVAVVAQAVGVPMLALGYAATITLAAVAGVRFVRAFAPMGRMALTNYLMQSAICVTLASGWGLGLWWGIGASRAMGIAAVVVLAQIPLSALWLSRFSHGPVEWVWRRLTYREPLR